MHAHETKENMESAFCLLLGMRPIVESVDGLSDSLLKKPDFPFPSRLRLHRDS